MENLTAIKLDTFKLLKMKPEVLKNEKKVIENPKKQKS